MLVHSTLTLTMSMMSVCLTNITIHKDKLAESIKATDSTYPQMVVNSLMEMEVATPAELTPAVTSVATTVGNLMNLMLGGGGAADQANSTGNGTDTVDPCAGVAVIDKVGQSIWYHLTLSILAV